MIGSPSLSIQSTSGDGATVADTSLASALPLYSSALWASGKVARRNGITLAYSFSALLLGLLAYLHVWRVTCMSLTLLLHMSHDMSHESTMVVWLRQPR